MNLIISHFKKTVWISVTIVLLLLLSACTNRNEITISFESNGGSQQESLTYDLTDQNLNLPEPTKEGYVFDGWYVDDEFIEVFSFDNIEKINEITLYAKWVEDDLVLITYDTLGGSQNQTIETNITDIPETYIPEKEGYVFSGWYLDQNYQNVYIFDNPIEEDTTLYAKWETRSEIVLTLIFSDDLVFEFNIEDGMLPDLTPTVPYKYASNTDGYFKDVAMRHRFNNDYDYIEQTMTLYAKLTDQYYIFYEQVELAEIDQYISPTYVLKDGRIFEFKENMYEKETLDHVGVYQKLDSGYELQPNISIESVTYYGSNEILIETSECHQYVTDS